MTPTSMTPTPMEKNSHNFYCCGLALGCRPIQETFRRMTNIFSIVNGVFVTFIFNDFCGSFLWKCFFSSTVDCLHSHFIVLLYGNGVGLGIIQRESRENGYRS